MPIRHHTANGLHVGFCDGRHSGRECTAMIALPRELDRQVKTIITLAWTIENGPGDDGEIFCSACSARNRARIGPTFVIDNEWTKRMSQACYELLRRENSYRDHDVIDLDNRANEMAREFAAICKAKGWTPE